MKNTMTKKELATLKRLHKKVMNGKATRKEVLLAIDLRRKLNREHQEAK